MAEPTEPAVPADRRQFLVHIEADLIRRVKILAINRGVSASSLVQQALDEFMLREAVSILPTTEPESK